MDDDAMLIADYFFDLRTAYEKIFERKPTPVEWSLVILHTADSIEADHELADQLAAIANYVYSQRR